jgi:hypothetical protein
MVVGFRARAQRPAGVRHRPSFRRRPASIRAMRGLRWRSGGAMTGAVPTILLDPTDERVPLARRAAPRPAALAGRIALLDISKARGDVFLDRLEERLRERAPGIEIVRYRKPTFTKPAPADLRLEIAERCSAVIEALAD